MSPSRIPLRYLSAADVLAAMPPLEERLRLARRTLVALVADAGRPAGAELPPKVAVHPRPEGSFGHAMPALLRGDRADGSGDLLGIKWVVGVPGNAARSLPALHATLLLDDATTGVPRGILDAGPITALRTAAVSGVAIASWAPMITGRAIRAAVVGAGVQGRSHVEMLAGVLPGAELSITDLDGTRARALASWATGSGSFSAVSTSPGVEGCIDGADVVITLVSFGAARQTVPSAAFAPGALIVAVDYDMCVPAAVARDAALFVVDEAGQFLANRATGIFAGYPDPMGIMGERLDQLRPGGRVLVTHLGVGLADVIFGEAILRTAAERGLGTILPA